MKENSKQVQEKRDFTDCFAVMSALPDDASVTMAYVPFQLDATAYECDTALMRGTLFPVLDKPFLRAACR